jgi:hypothetical protein
MFPAQTLQVCLGAMLALLYAGTVAAVGILPLTRAIGQEARAAVRARVGLSGFVWLGFIIGQGILGVVWLVLALAGVLYPWLIWSVCALGLLLGCITLFAGRREVVQTMSLMRRRLLSCLHRRSWYFWVGTGIAIICLLRGIMALLPTENDDALHKYLTMAKVIADSGKLDFQPFVPPFYGLLPLQVEMHWAALFAISNETAVTVWDYLCALSFLGGVGLLAWSLTSSRRVVLLAVLMMLSTPGVLYLMGSGKVDNAAAQYGIAAFVWLVLWPVAGRWAMIFAGLCVGWALAGRYTDAIILPAVLLFTIVVVHQTLKASPDTGVVKRLNVSWVYDILWGGLAIGFAGAPMLVKNWLLVGCPLAPHFGCQETFWARLYGPHHAHLQNISVGDLLLYPFIWTFSHRPDMLGNISPLFLGFFPFFLLLYRRLPFARRSFIAGLAGLTSMVMWFLIEPLTLFTRWLLIPLGLLTVPLSTSVVAAEQSLRWTHTARWLVRGAVLTMLFFLLFQSRGVLYAVRYLAAIDSRAMRYASVPHFGYDVADWLNTHVQATQRVALSDYHGYPYFVNSRILLNSESAEELQWLWEHRSRLSPVEVWKFYARRGFTYAVVAKGRVDEARSIWPRDERLQVAFVGRNDAVLRIGEM